MINKGTKEIKIEGLGYHFETMKDFEHSFYRNVYREAYFRVEDIIKSVSRYEKMQKRSRVVLQADFPNIITFIGARGVGKTSVMLSFMEALKDYRGMKGGFRSVCVDYLDVDEQNVKYKMGNMTMKGPKQIRTLNPYEVQQAETVAGTKGVKT